VFDIETVASSAPSSMLTTGPRQPSSVVGETDPNNRVVVA
jgi:hypothetical protein